jgi:hypothetical protein
VWRVWEEILKRKEENEVKSGIWKEKLENKRRIGMDFNVREIK